MENLFDKWKTRIPKYNEEFRGTLFESLSKTGGGGQAKMHSYGKLFENNYELYMYAFFLGLYNDECIAIPEGAKKVDFNHAIQHWGSKANRLNREDFTVLQEYIFAALIAKTDVDLIALEKGETNEDEVAKQLIHTMESYTNGGLTLLKEQLEENPNFFLKFTSFLDLILDSKLGSDKMETELI